jgi:hypothetical protein
MNEKNIETDKTPQLKKPDLNDPKPADEDTKRINEALTDADEKRRAKKEAEAADKAQRVKETQGVW